MEKHTANQKASVLKDRKVLLSTLWIFAMFNYLYADYFTLIDILTDAKASKRLSEGFAGGVHMTQGFMFAAAVLMETAIAMVLLSRILPYRANRWANIIIGVIHTAAVAASLFAGGVPRLTYYVLFASVEIACTAVIIWYSWTWRRDVAAETMPALHADAGSQVDIGRKKNC